MTAGVMKTLIWQTFSLVMLPNVRRVASLRAFSTASWRISAQFAGAEVQVANPSPTWHTARVVECGSAGADLYGLSVEVPQFVRSAYTSPGQYVRVRNGEKSTLLSMASPPDKHRLMEFIVKRSAHHEHLVGLRKGDVMHISDPMGCGFQAQQVLEREGDSIDQVLLVACGSGLAPIAAVIDSGILGMRKTRLYLGARSPAHLPSRDRHADWAQKGVQVVPVYSREGGEEGRQKGKYVQEALRGEGIREPGSTLALLCGMRGMTEEVGQLLRTAGVPSHRILLNI